MQCEARIGSTTKNLQFEEIFDSLNVDMMKFIARKTLFILSDAFLKNDFYCLINYLHESLSEISCKEIGYWLR